MKRKRDPLGLEVKRRQHQSDDRLGNDWIEVALITMAIAAIFGGVMFLVRLSDQVPGVQ